MLLTILGRLARQVAKMTCGFVTPKKKGEQLDCYIFTVEKGNWKCLPCSNRGASPFSVRTHIDWVFFSSSSHVAQRFSWHSREIKIPFLDEWTQLDRYYPHWVTYFSRTAVFSTIVPCVCCKVRNPKSYVLDESKSITTFIIADVQTARASKYTNTLEPAINFG